MATAPSSPRTITGKTHSNRKSRRPASPPAMIANQLFLRRSCKVTTPPSSAEKTTQPVSVWLKFTKCNSNHPTSNVQSRWNCRAGASPATLSVGKRSACPTTATSHFFTPHSSRFDIQTPACFASGALPNDQRHAQQNQGGTEQCPSGKRFPGHKPPEQHRQRRRDQRDREQIRDRDSLHQPVEQKKCQHRPKQREIKQAAHRDFAPVKVHRIPFAQQAYED